VAFTNDGVLRYAKKYSHLSKTERQEIQELKDKGYGVRAIARMLGRSPTAVGNELNRNKVSGAYVADKAHAKAQATRRAAKFQGKKIVANKELCSFIEQSLLNWQSPEGIAGRLKAGLEPGLPYVSRPTIERYIASVHGRRIEHELKLLKAGRKRRGRKKRPYTATAGDEKVYIDERPDVIKNRERVGDLEVDFIVSGKTGTGYCLTAADRKLRTGFIRLALPVTVGNALEALQDIKQQFPELTSITTDNDILWRYHKKLEQLLGVPFYFCHPYSSWEKGSVENFNGQVRRYIKKGSDISQYGEVYLRQTEDKLNDRYMAVLGYRTPKEALEEYRQRYVDE
jgi:IS30 family transposase